jgi:hypothetical protein
MSTQRGFAVCAFGTSIRVAAEGAEAYAILDRFVFPSLPRDDSATSAPDIYLCIVQAGDGVQLIVGERAVVTAPSAVALVPHIIHVLDEAVLLRLPPLRAVHAGAVELSGKAILLPGSTHSGKSSLVAELLRRGAAYLSDEFALVDADGFVHAYPRPILLRAGDGEQTPLLAEECGAKIASAPVPVGWILNLEYGQATPWQVEEVPQSVALLSLLRNTPHAVADSPGTLAAFERAVAGAACFAGSRGDAAEAAAHILELVAARP